MKNLEFNTDYVEFSSRFRDWLHHFTEYANCFAQGSGIEPWRVPYHHGSFRNFEGIDFRKMKNIYLQELMEEIEDDFYRADETPPSRQFILKYLLPSDWKHKFRYDIITFGNFLTQESQVKSLSAELRSVAFALRNNGIILIVGGRGKHYPKVYELITKILMGRKYRLKRSIFIVEELFRDGEKELSYKYSLDNRFGNKLLSFYKKILERIREHNSERYMDSKILKCFNKVSSRNEISQRWAIRVFIKRRFSPKN